MTRYSNHRTQRGLTLTELMIVLAVLTVTSTVAVPVLDRIQTNYQLRSGAHRLAAAFNLARTEALSRRSQVVICPGQGDQVCSGGFRQGWVLFLDDNLDGAHNPAEPIILQVPGLPGRFSVSNRSGSEEATEAVAYRADGSTGRNLTLLLCAPGRPDTDSYGVVLNQVGRVRLARGEGQCPGSQV